MKKNLLLVALSLMTALSVFYQGLTYQKKSEAKVDKKGNLKVEMQPKGGIIAQE